MPNDELKGWRNQATQITADYFIRHDDHWLATARACWSAEGETPTKADGGAIEKLSRYMKQFIHEKLTPPTDGIASMLMHNAFGQVDFEQIASAYLEEVGTEVDQQLTEEAMAKYMPEYKYEQERREQEAEVGHTDWWKE